VDLTICQLCQAKPSWQYRTIQSIPAAPCCCFNPAACCKFRTGSAPYPPYKIFRAISATCSLGNLEAAQLPGSLPDVDAAVINTNYANVLAVNAGEEQDPRVQALARALNSPHGGADLPTVQLLLGHSDLKATSIHLYLGAPSESGGRAAEMTSKCSIGRPQCSAGIAGWPRAV